MIGIIKRTDLSYKFTNECFYQSESNVYCTQICTAFVKYNVTIISLLRIEFQNNTQEKVFLSQEGISLWRRDCFNIGIQKIKIREEANVRNHEIAILILLNFNIHWVLKSFLIEFINPKKNQKW